MKKILIIDDNFNVQDYNQKAVHPLQSWEWGEARKAMGVDVLRLGEFEINDLVEKDDLVIKKGSLKNVFQVTFHKIPYTPYKIGYLPRSIFPSEKIMTFLEQLRGKKNLIFIKIEPYVENSIFKSKRSRLLFKTQKLLKSKNPLFPNWTIKIDLTKSEEELLKKMKPKTRYNIRLAQKKGVVVREMTNNRGFEIFANLYFKTCQRQKYYGHNYQYHRIIFENLKKKIAHILIAFYKNTPLSAYEIFLFNNVLYYPYGGSSLEYRNLMGANLLMWETIKFGKRMGAKIFDMWGSLPPDYQEKNSWAGFTRFKEGYGGEFVEMIGSFDLVFNRSLYYFYNFVYRLRNWWLGH